MSEAGDAQPAIRRDGTVLGFDYSKLPASPATAPANPTGP